MMIEQRDFTSWAEAVEFFGGRCAYCLEPLREPPAGRGRATAGQDHVIPVGRGGVDDFSNLVPACTKCNSTKGPRLFVTMLWPSKRPRPKWQESIRRIGYRYRYRQQLAIPAHARDVYSYNDAEKKS